MDADWISVKEMLPDNGVDVLMAATLRGHIRPLKIGWYFDGSDKYRAGWQINGREYRGVTHWQHLPDQPYRLEMCGARVRSKQTPNG